MLQFHAERFLEVVNTFAQLRATLDRYSPEAQAGGKIILTNTPELEHNLNHLAEIFEAMKMPVCCFMIYKIWKALQENSELTFPQLRDLLSDTYLAFHKELSERTFLGIPPALVGYYKQESPIFGPEVADRFSSRASFEIDEAAKCFALSRPTACVFHLMRVVECGLNAIYLSLGLPPLVREKDRSWGNLIRKITDEIEKRDRTNPSGWPERGFYKDTRATLGGIKDAWRDSTMHVENKYLPEEAENIFNAVRSFMVRIAAKIDENGDFVNAQP